MQWLRARTLRFFPHLPVFRLEGPVVYYIPLHNSPFENSSCKQSEFSFRFATGTRVRSAEEVPCPPSVFFSDEFVCHGVLITSFQHTNQANTGRRPAANFFLGFERKTLTCHKRCPTIFCIGSPVAADFLSMEALGSSDIMLFPKFSATLCWTYCDSPIEQTAMGFTAPSTGSKDFGLLASTPQFDHWDDGASFLGGQRPFRLAMCTKFSKHSIWYFGGLCGSFPALTPAVWDFVCSWICGFEAVTHFRSGFFLCIHFCWLDCRVLDLHMVVRGGALSAVRVQCTRSATIWASGRSRNPYFVVLWASLLFGSRF